MYCTKCGKQIQEGQCYCPNCGTPVLVTDEDFPRANDNVASGMVWREKHRLQ